MLGVCFMGKVDLLMSVYIALSQIHRSMYSIIESIPSALLLSHRI